MSEPEDLGGEDTPHELAAEYVLGVLDDGARRLAAERSARDPLFRAEVEAWERHLGPMLSEVGELTAPPAVWRRLSAAVAPTASPVVSRFGRLFRDSFGLWSGTALIFAAAAGFAIAIILRPAPPPGQTQAAPSVARPSLSARLATPAGAVIFVAVLDGSKPNVTIIPIGRFRAQGRSPELWIIPQGGKPMPVGLIEAQRPQSLTSSALSRATAKTLLAVSLEPPGGSQTGAPTGPIVATGTLAAIV